MKVRKKITLWIAGASLLSTVGFSVFIVYELMEVPYSLIDQELDHMAAMLVKAKGLNATENFTDNISSLPYTPDRYWIRISDDQGIPLYESALTSYTDVTDVSGSGEKKRYNVEKDISRAKIWLGQDDYDVVTFRVRVIKTSIDHHPVTVTIAKPIEDIEEEYNDLLRKTAISLLFCSLFIVVISYKLAGKILQPVASIAHMAKEISEKSLDKRIPLTRTRDEFHDLSQALNRMFDRLQFSFNRQREFIGNASHELKSPITLLKIAQEELLMDDQLSPPVRSNLTRQLNTTLRMSKLVRNLLDLSRLEQSETIKRVPVDLKLIIGQVLEDYKELLSDKDISVDCHLQDDLILQGDPEKLVRLFVNLIDNGIRYNLLKKGVIRVLGEKKRGKLLLKLSNTGERIPEQELSLIFEQFYRVEKSRSKVHGGTGLGLTIARKIVELHGGTIALTNEPGGFIQVSIFWPLNV